jgi:cytochrome P450
VDVLAGLTPFPPAPETAAEVHGVIADMEGCLKRAMEASRGAPNDTIVSELLRAEVDGRSLSAEEILSFLFLLLPAALEPPFHFLSLAMLTLAEHPECIERLRREPSRIPGFLDEVLRCHTDQAIIREVMADVTLSGVAIPKGAVIAVLTDSANHDARQFSAPQVFDIERAGGGGLAFGHGIHFCLGAALARLEGRVAMEALLARFTGVALGGEIKWQYRIIGAGPASLPLCWS